MGAHLYDSALGRQRQDFYKFKVSWGHASKPYPKKNQANININKNQKSEEKVNRRPAACGLGPALLESQGAGTCCSKAVWGKFHCSLSAPPLGKCFKKMMRRNCAALAFCLLIPVTPSHVTETTKNQLELH